MSIIQVTAKCPCGEPLALDDSTHDETILICKNCGLNVGTYGDLKRQATSAVADKWESMARDIFNN
jgi:hypothetical protein